MSPQVVPDDLDPLKQSSTDSYVRSSMEDPSFSNIAASSGEDQSASQILRGSDVFHSPTVRRSLSASRARDGEHKRAADRRKVLETYSGKHAATTGAVPDPGTGEKSAQQPMTPTIQQSLTRMGAYQLGRAGVLAGFLSRQSRRMSGLLATETMGYVEKVSGMWKGASKHYDETPGVTPIDGFEFESEEKIKESNARFHQYFGLPTTEKLQATYFAHLVRVLPLYGKIYISDRSFCFRSLLPGTRTKLVLPLKDMDNVEQGKGVRLGYSGLVVVIRGHEELFFEFGRAVERDDCLITCLNSLDIVKYREGVEIVDKGETDEAECAAAERDALKATRHPTFPIQDQDDIPKTLVTPQQHSPTLLFDDAKASMHNYKPKESMTITCLTIGSRGDVQPYIALCKGLQAEGHTVRIATHEEFRGWIEGHGIEFRRVGGDPSELMRLCIEYGTFTISFLREANSKFRGWIDDLLATSWEACQGSDLLIESPSAMAGIHIAERLEIPYFRAFGMPWTRTRAYPHAFAMPNNKMGGTYNYFTYVMFDNVFWKATATQINKWRNKALGLPSTSLEKMQPNKVPFVYNYSPTVVPPPLDYSDWVRVTGYWFLNEGTETSWEPPAELAEFIAKARRDGKKLVYVGFGSIIVPDPAKMTQDVIDAVQKADVRCILSKGWSDRLPGTSAAAAATAEDPNAPTPMSAEVALPPEILQIKSAPHDWLFKQIDAAAHHGGSGTTGASLRAGIPTIIRPFFGDQFFSGSRVEDLGVGICLKKWGANSFARALWEATHSERMIQRAKTIGEDIRKVSEIHDRVSSSRGISSRFY